jgi:hypothetical protein
MDPLTTCSDSTVPTTARMASLNAAAASLKATSLTELMPAFLLHENRAMDFAGILLSLSGNDNRFGFISQFWHAGFFVFTVSQFFDSASTRVYTSMGVDSSITNGVDMSTSLSLEGSTSLIESFPADVLGLSCMLTGPVAARRSHAFLRYRNPRGGFRAKIHHFR